MPYTVMLVDNEAIIPRGLMCLIDWKAHNCCVRAIANDGVDAVHQIQESPPDILITDIRMPEMDGLQLCGWVREHYPGIQMILLTGFPDFEYAQQAIQCGDGFRSEAYHGEGALRCSGQGMPTASKGKPCAEEPPAGTAGSVGRTDFSKPTLAALHSQ